MRESLTIVHMTQIHSGGQLKRVQRIGVSLSWRRP
jgi:hypothetical protein